MFKDYLLKRKKIKYIKSRTRTTYWKLWDLEFLKEKLRAIKEGFRVEYDRYLEQIDAAHKRLNKEKDNTEFDPKIKENLDNLIKTRTQDTEQLKKQMDGIDNQINGVGGVDESIEGYKTVIKLLKEYIKTI